MPITDQLKKILDSATAVHGYIFVGMDTQAIKSSLEELLKELENEIIDASLNVSARIAEPNSAPLIDTEFFYAKKGESLGIDAARRLKEFLWQKPVKSRRKTAVIVDGDSLTPEAQNALLKISEDPPPSAQIFVILKNEENLLPTLRSRFSKIYLAEEASSKKTGNNIPEEIMRFAERFLKGDKQERGAIIKTVTGRGDETEDDITLLFLDALIFKLSKEPVKYASFLDAVLERKVLISSLSLNRRLQLAYLSSLWYNR